MAESTITLISMNCQGLSSKTKRADTLNFLKSKRYSIYMLQDTHFTNKEENYIRTQWGFDCFFNNFASNSRGVAILLNNNFESKVQRVEKDDSGNFLILDIQIEDNIITLVNIYGPNRDDPEFYKLILSKINDTDNQVIIAGDFNLLLNPEKDSVNYVNINNPKAREEVLNMIIEVNLVDVWRELNLEKQQFTWRRKATNQQARLDYFLISETLFTSVEEAKILPGYKTDHSLLLLKFDFRKFKKGKSYWKFNNSLLKDEKYVAEIKDLIKTTTLFYANKDSENYPDFVTQPDLIDFTIDDDLFFDVLLMEIRGKTIAYSTFKKGQFIDKEKNILEEIESLENREHIEYELLESKRKELYDIRQIKMEGVKIRSKARWINDGEKVTKYFCNMENRNYVSKCMNSLRKEDGNLLTDQNEIVNETMRFYKKLYTKRNNTELDLNNMFLEEDIPKLTEKEKILLEGPIRNDEILFSLKKSSNNTSPGCDGFTYEFFKFFWRDLGVYLLRAVNTCFNKGELTDSLKRGIITCIPKGNKDKLLLKNWRPISLLNTSYKLASSSIAERLKLVLPSIINEDQTGFISGRYIGENIRILYDVLQYTEDHNLPGMLLLIDFEKAFDSVSWDFLFNVLNFFNFGDSFIKWVKLFYNKCQSCVIVNGHLSEWFYLQRGCRQGDPLSPYLFVICAEILAILIRRHGGIKGITMGGVEFLVSQYADDTSLILDGSRESLENCLKVLKLYANASGLCVNIDKTKVVWIGSRKSSNLRFCEEVNLHWEMNEFTVLGVKFTYNLKDMVDLNYSDKLNEIRKMFLNWSKRILTPLGKITVIKSLALSKMNHLILALPNPSKKITDELQKMFYQYLWDKKPDKIKRAVITQNYTEGGLRMIEVCTFMKSLKLTWLRRILLNRNKYNDFVHNEFPFIGECLQYGSKYLDSLNINIMNSFWKDVMLSLNSFLDKVKPNSWKELLSIPLWYNQSIKVGGNVIFYRSWKNKGILMINDLLDPNGDLLTYVEFQRKYQLQSNFLAYEGIVKSIKDYIFSFRYAPFLYRQENPVLTYSLYHILKSKKGCRDIYDKLNTHIR